MIEKQTMIRIKRKQISCGLTTVNQSWRCGCGPAGLGPRLIRARGLSVGRFCLLRGALLQIVALDLRLLQIVASVCELVAKGFSLQSSSEFSRLIG